MIATLLRKQYISSEIQNACLLWLMQKRGLTILMQFRTGTFVCPFIDIINYNDLCNLVNHFLNYFPD